MFFHDTKDSIDEENEEVKEVTLEILYDQIKLYSSELFIELDDVKKDLYKQIKSEINHFMMKFTASRKISKKRIIS